MHLNNQKNGLFFRPFSFNILIPDNSIPYGKQNRNKPKGRPQNAFLRKKSKHAEIMRAQKPQNHQQTNKRTFHLTDLWPPTLATVLKSSVFQKIHRSINHLAVVKRVFMNVLNKDAFLGSRQICLFGRRQFFSEQPRQKGRQTS